jgi:hypothetical protein
MDTTITLDAEHFKAAADTARELGTTPAAYVQSLIDAATMSFDEILGPVRDGFRADGMSEDELDEAVSEARQAFHAQERRKGSK